MWTNPTAAVKCPRGDCRHYECHPDESPCCTCTCNRQSDAACRTFRYEPNTRKEATP